MDEMRISRARRTGWLLWRALVTLYDEGGLSIAKGAAYSGLLSFFPALTTLALVLVRLRAEQAVELIARFFFEVVPPGARSLVTRRLMVAGEKPESLLVIAMLVSLWAASGVILSLVEGFNAIYHVPTERPLVRGRLVAIALVFCCVLPALGATFLILFGSRTEVWVITRLGIIDPNHAIAGGVALLGKLARYLVALGAAVVTSMVLYKIGPNRPTAWRDTWPGALVATAFWLAATQGFSYYVRNIADYNLLYGSIGAVIALLLWMYLLAVISLYGCAFNAELERLKGAARDVNAFKDRV
jgi:membrane protein